MSDNSDSQNDSAGSLPNNPVSSYPTERSSPSSFSSPSEKQPSSSAQNKPCSSIPETRTRPATHPSTSFNYYQRTFPSPGLRQRGRPSVPRPPVFPAASSSFAPTTQTSVSSNHPTSQPPPRRSPSVEIKTDFEDDDFGGPFYPEPFQPEPLATIFPSPPQAAQTSPSASEGSTSGASQTYNSSKGSPSSSEGSSKTTEGSSSTVPVVSKHFKSCAPKPFRKRAEKMEEEDKAARRRAKTHGSGMSEAEKEDIYGDILEFISLKSLSENARDEGNKVDEVDQPQKEMESSVREEDARMHSLE